MAVFFLLIIYLSFISLGLPDSLLGVAWPVMQLEYGVPFGAAGLVSMIISGGTIVSALASGAVHKRLNTGTVTFISCLMTASSLLGFYFAPSFIWLLFLAVPLGLGAGAVDAALNNYVATHYKAHHMSWLHCFWGVGATLGPIIMARFISGQNSWRNGYLSVSVIQFVLVALLFFTLPLWKKVKNEVNVGYTDLGGDENGSKNVVHNKTVEKAKPLQIKGVKLALISFFFYCGLETTIGLWGSSFLVNIKELPAAIAAEWVSMYYAGITVGRLVVGFITLKVTSRVLIRMGQAVVLAGAMLLLLPLPAIFSLFGFIMVGLGCAPIFPCMLHETPARFGKGHSQTIIGYQMASAYTGITLLPPFLGWLASHTTIGIFPFFVLIYAIIMFIGSEKINSIMKAKNILTIGKYAK